MDATIIGTEEYFQNRAGGTVDGFLTYLYGDVLNRPVDATGQAAFEAVLANGGSRTTVEPGKTH